MKHSLQKTCPPEACFAKLARREGACDACRTSHELMFHVKHLSTHGIKDRSAEAAKTALKRKAARDAKIPAPPLRMMRNARTQRAAKGR